MVSETVCVRTQLPGGKLCWGKAELFPSQACPEASGRMRPGAGSFAFHPSVFSPHRILPLHISSPSKPRVEVGKPVGKGGWDMRRAVPLGCIQVGIWHGESK